MKKKALITGITGQDGAYLASFLLKKNYEVYGTCRSKNHNKLWRLKILNIDKHKNLHLIKCDISNIEAAIQLLDSIHPTEIYNLAAISSVIIASKNSNNTIRINAMIPFYL